MPSPSEGQILSTDPNEQSPMSLLEVLRTFASTFQRGGNEDVREKLLSLAGVPDNNIASLLASLAMVRNESKAIPGPFQKQLGPSDEKAFEDWVKEGNVRFDLKTPTPDYDMRSWWAGMKQHDPKATYKFDKTLRLLFPSAFTTPYSLDFGPDSIYWKKQ